MIGVPGRSNAFAISRRLGLDEQLLERANTLVSNQDKSLETVIERLEQSRQQYEAKEAEYQKKLSDYNHRFEKMEEDQKKLDEEKEQILERAREKARKLVEDIQLQTDLLFEQVDRLRKEKEQEEFSRRAAGNQIEDPRGTGPPASGSKPGQRTLQRRLSSAPQFGIGRPRADL